MNTINTILKRQSCRNFKDEQVSKEQIEQILIAANASPVGMAKYECFNITVIQNKELLNKLEENAVNYMPQNPNKHPLYNAPTANFNFNEKRIQAQWHQCMYKVRVVSWKIFYLHQLN